MHLPSELVPTAASLDDILLSGHGADSSSGRYSSLIGIITAIVGNTLISFALNIQRYAHIRLRHEQEEQLGRQSLPSSRTSDSDLSNYRSCDHDGTTSKASLKPATNGQTRVQSAESPSDDETQSLLKHNIGQDHNDADSGSESSEDIYYTKHYLHSPWWWLGMVLMIVGESGNFLAYGFAPASIVSPLGVVALVANCLIAPLMLGEHFRVRDGLGVMIAIAGCVTVVLSATGTDKRLDADQIWELITNWEFETYIGITLCLIVVLMVVSNRYPGKSIFVDLGLMGLFGGYTALSTKGVASLLSHDLWRIVTFPLTYLLVAVLVATAIMQIHYINKALQTYNSTQVIPTQFVLFSISVIVGSAVLYRDFEEKTANDAAEFIGGCLLTFLGVWCITAGRHDAQSRGQVAEDDEQETAESRPGMIGTGQEGDNRPDTQSHTAQTPVFTLTTDDVDNALRSQTPDTSSVAYHAWQQVLPSIDSAIHAGTAGPLAPISHKHSERPQMHATTSTPTVHTTYTQQGRPQLPPRHTAASPELGVETSLKTPEHGAMRSNVHSPLLRSVTRSTFASILPSPSALTNPLSSSLNAIIIDSLRGIEQPTHHERRPLRSVRSHGIRRAAGLGLGSDVHASASSPRSTNEQGQVTLPVWRGQSSRAMSEGAPSPTPRSPFSPGRSVSSTIGDFLGLNKGTKDDQVSGRNPQ